MQWLNYHHLLYFWAVARRGTVAAAAAELSLSGPTLSAQIRSLEESLGEKLLRRSGRRLVLTDAGRMVMPYAEEIFSLGQQVTQALEGHAGHAPMRLAVGMVNIVPRWVAFRSLEPALRIPQRIRLVFREDSPERLLADLAAHDLDLVLSDMPLLPEMRAQLFTHLLGQSAISLYAVPRLATAYRQRFPRSLNGAPLLLLNEHTAMGRALDLWLESQQVRPRIVGRFDDFTMARVFAEAGEAILPAPCVIENELVHRYGMRHVGRIASANLAYYAISLERKLKHPGIDAICQADLSKVFSAPAAKRRRAAATLAG